jgi:hypothetical protein
MFRKLARAARVDREAARLQESFPQAWRGGTATADEWFVETLEQDVDLGEITASSRRLGAAVREAMAVAEEKYAATHGRTPALKAYAAAFSFRLDDLLRSPRAVRYQEEVMTDHLRGGPITGFRVQAEQARAALVASGAREGMSFFQMAGLDRLALCRLVESDLYLGASTLTPDVLALAPDDETRDQFRVAAQARQERVRRILA